MKEIHLLELKQWHNKDMHEYAWAVLLNNALNVYDCIYFLYR